ncbi:sulfurtransferase TusA family protein [Brevibacillus nitrificans]|uniref:sulfurtransferase TusA family protein n=1 Tax=Brevibacillus nitrificans TaxID=651560 RepID=UPI002861EA51|nr:sulfurtransferase TusA family protein [Brevibacillus nitrificans]MDR7317503.1 TusA-related sulfurtransferase/rhodanese-related sulfurtransferase [Brevibacillus nitrificans]
MTNQPTITVDQVLDCKGLACPMPIVRTKKAIDQLQPGQVIEVQATDKGSLADLQGWAKNTGHQYLGTIHEGDVLKHFLRKANANETKLETSYPHTITNDEFAIKLQKKEPIVVLDVREPAEYRFQRIPEALSIPLGVLEANLFKLKPEDEIFVICRSGNRSDMACQLLAEKGFTRVKNVVPGMSEWTGPIENQ